MARPIRIEYPGAWYHVTCRGNERKAIFRDDRDRYAFLSILATSLKTFKVSLHGYVLMDNHFHLIIETHEANLGKLMQRFNTAYTVYYNRRHSRDGHLYQGRYKAILIDADEYLMELSRYVHLNPVRVRKYSGVSIKEKEAMMEAYRWSSYRGYIRPRERQPFVVYDTILTMAGGHNPLKAPRYYKRFVLSGITDDMSETYWGDIKWQFLKGTEAFAEQIYGTFMNRQGTTPSPSGTAYPPHRAITINEIAGHVATVCNVEKDELYRKRSSSAAARPLFMEFCCQYMNSQMSLTDIGRTLGNVSVAALSHNRRRLSDRKGENKAVQQLYEEIKKRLEQA